jgi:dipicolinate synthase subunit A
MALDGTFAVIGGDKRSAYLAQILIGRRYKVKTAGLELSGIVDAAHINTLNEALAAADYIIMPLPLLDKNGQMPCDFSNSRLDACQIIGDSRPESVIFAGRIPGAVSAFSQECGRELHDYYLREELQVMNAVPTAEGVAELLIKRLPTTIAGSRLLVTGFGRTARALCLLLRAMGARVTVAARRREDLACAMSMGCGAMDISRLSENPVSCDALINTVPARIITAHVLEMVPAGCYIIDIASAPGGVDVACAIRCGIAVESALSLPGKVAPKTAGGIIADTVINMIAERECAR